MNRHLCVPLAALLVVCSVDSLRATPLPGYPVTESVPENECFSVGCGGNWSLPTNCRGPEDKCERTTAASVQDNPGVWLWGTQASSGYVESVFEFCDPGCPETEPSGICDDSAGFTLSITISEPSISIAPGITQATVVNAITTTLLGSFNFSPGEVSRTCTGNVTLRCGRIDACKWIRKYGKMAVKDNVSFKMTTTWRHLTRFESPDPMDPCVWDGEWIDWNDGGICGTQDSSGVGQMCIVQTQTGRVGSEGNCPAPVPE